MPKPFLIKKEIRKNMPLLELDFVTISHSVMHSSNEFWMYIASSTEFRHHFDCCLQTLDKLLLIWGMHYNEESYCISTREYFLDYSTFWHSTRYCQHCDTWSVLHITWFVNFLHLRLSMEVLEVSCRDTWPSSLFSPHFVSLTGIASSVYQLSNLRFKSKA